MAVEVRNFGELSDHYTREALGAAERGEVTRAGRFLSVVGGLMQEGVGLSPQIAERVGLSPDITILRIQVIGRARFKAAHACLKTATALMRSHPGDQRMISIAKLFIEDAAKLASRNGF